jgi:hypothetical protein
MLCRKFDQFDTNGNGTIDKSELGAVLRASGIRFSKAELLQMFDELDLSADGVISRREFKTFFDAHLSTQANARKYNRLLLKSKIGKGRSSSYNLPGDYHRYGAELKRDKEGSGQVIFNWTDFKAPTGSSEKKLNIVKMNRRAVTKGGMTKVKDINAYNRAHKIYDTKTISGSRSRRELINRYRYRPELRDRTFGITAEKDTDIGALIENRFNPYTAADEPIYPRNTASDNRARRRANAQKFDRMRPTKASLGHAMARQRLNQEPEKRFKMRRFDNVKGRLGGAGKQVVGGF